MKHEYELRIMVFMTFYNKDVYEGADPDWLDYAPRENWDFIGPDDRDETIDKYEFEELANIKPEWRPICRYADTPTKTGSAVRSGPTESR